MTDSAIGWVHRYNQTGTGAFMGSIGFYIMIVLLGAGAAYGLANKGKPKPALSSTKKKLVIVLFGIAAACFLLAFAVVALSRGSAQH